MRCTCLLLTQSGHAVLSMAAPECAFHRTAPNRYDANLWAFGGADATARLHYASCWNGSDVATRGAQKLALKG